MLAKRIITTFRCVNLPGPVFFKNAHGLVMTLRNYAAVGSKILPEKEDKGFIDLNTEKLCSYVCVNYLVEGGEDRKILPDSEYPPWLFELKLGRRKELEDLDPEVDGWLYWRAYRLRQLHQIHRIEKLKHKFINLQNSPTMRKSGYRGKKTSLYEKKNIVNERLQLSNFPG
ncbi:39S ribosomal protein L54 [Dirofilaria immitis]